MLMMMHGPLLLLLPPLLLLRPALALAASAATPSPLSSPPPHIFVFFADDAGYNDFGFTRGLLAPDAAYTGPQPITPEIDLLAKGGIVLKSSYAYRYCSPSRASFLTGRLPYHAHENNPGIGVRGCTNLNYTMIPKKLAAGP